jgi:hypothetical protein
MPFYLMLAMQAAGMITDWFGVHQQAKIMNMGMKANEAGIEANIAQSQLQAEDESLQAMQQLRQTMGTQIATFAARGTATFGGSAAALLNESTANFKSDERIRKINAMGRENQYKANKTIGRLNNMADTSKLWQGFASRTFNRFPTSLSGWKQGITEIREGFGLTKIGS